APARRPAADPHPRLGPDRDRPGRRVRLLGGPGVQGAARGGLRDRPRQLQPRDDHDRPGAGRRDVRRAAPARAGGEGHRARAPRRAAAHPRGPDGAEPRQGARRRRDARALRRRAHRGQLRRHHHGGGPRSLPGRDGGRRPEDAGQRDRHEPRRGRRGRRAPGAAVHRAPRVHARRARRRDRPHPRGAARHSGARHRRVPDRAGPARPVRDRLGGVRAGGHARRGGQRRDRVLHREPRPDGRPHGRLGHRRPAADAQRPPLPAPARPGHARHPHGRRGDGRLERAVRGASRDGGDPRHRDEPARVALERPGLEGHGLPHREDRRAPGRGLHARGDPERHHGRRHAGRVRADDRLRRGQVAALRLREVRRGVHGALHAHEERGGGDGVRADLRPGVREGDALPRARRGPPARRARPPDAAGLARAPGVRPLRRRARGLPPRRSHGGRPRPHGHRPLVPARAGDPRPRPRGALRRSALLPRRGHVRGGVRGGHAVLLLRLGAHGRLRGGALGPPERRHPRRGPEPDRAGHRVRLLLRARRDDGPGLGPRRGDGQLQPRDGLHGLRHVRPAVLRAADARGRARRGGGGAPRGGHRPVRGPDAAEARGGARGGRRAAAGHERRRHRPGGGPRALRRAPGPPGLRGAAVRHRALGRRGARRVPAGRLPPARAPELRPRRPGDGDRLLPRRPGRLPAPPRPRRAAHLPRPLPGERDRGGRRRPLRRGGRLDRRDHAARRGGRDPLGRLGVRAAAPLARAGDARAHPDAHARDRAGPRRGRAPERPVRGPRRAAVRHRGQPARLADGAVRLQGRRGPAGEDGLPGDARRAPGRPRPPGRPHGRRPHRGQGGRAAVRPARGLRRAARAGDALHGRGHGHRRRLPDGVRQGPGRGGRPAAPRGDGLHLRDGRRQARGGGDRPGAARRGLPGPGHPRDEGGHRAHGHPGRVRAQARRGPSARRRPHRPRRGRPRGQHAHGLGRPLGRLGDPPGGGRARRPVPDHHRGRARGRPRDRRAAPRRAHRGVPPGAAPRLAPPGRRHV
ncbi:MAG: Carbamoyl-phosphate synthase large chain, partial [uncultured Solirubrobacteraceae bacterium]